MQQGTICTCSLNCLIGRYEEAKRNSDAEFLNLLRKKHRQAREFLDDLEVKEKLKRATEVRYATMENRAILSTVSNIFGLIQHFPETALGRLLAPLIPQLAEIVPQITGAVSPEVAHR